MTAHESTTNHAPNDAQRSGHGCELLPLRDGIYTTGYATACACGWTSEPHDTPGAALTAYARHIRTVKD
jgi:hypothetical protein